MHLEQAVRSGQMPALRDAIHKARAADLPDDEVAWAHSCLCEQERRATASLRPTSGAGSRRGGPALRAEVAAQDMSYVGSVENEPPDIVLAEALLHDESMT